MKFFAYDEVTGESGPVRTSRAVAQNDAEIFRWMKGGKWYVREVL